MCIRLDRKSCSNDCVSPNTVVGTIHFVFILREDGKIWKGNRMENYSHFLF